MPVFADGAIQYCIGPDAVSGGHLHKLVGLIMLTVSCSSCSILLDIFACSILKSVSHRRCNNNITDVAQEVMLQHSLPQETKLRMSPALYCKIDFFLEVMVERHHLVALSWCPSFFF